LQEQISHTINPIKSANTIIKMAKKLMAISMMALIGTYLKMDSGKVMCKNGQELITISITTRIYAEIMPIYVPTGVTIICLAVQDG